MTNCSDHNSDDPNVGNGNGDDVANDDAMTLDPPGTIAVVGAGPLGIEAALYGRFLGYNVTLIEAVSVGGSMSDRTDAPLPIMPNRCLSPLALAALRAQRETNFDHQLPMTFGQWIDQALIPLTETDLLRGRLRMPARVDSIIHVTVEPDDDDDTDEADLVEIPPDYRLVIKPTNDDEKEIDAAEFDAEAVVLAVGEVSEIKLGFEEPSPYFYRIGAQTCEDAERGLHLGLREIVDLYAGLAGRADLDLYRPRRV